LERVNTAGRCHRGGNKTRMASILLQRERPVCALCRLDGHNQLPKIILGVKFTDGIEVVRSQA
jgi:putative transposase